MVHRYLLYGNCNLIEFGQRILTHRYLNFTLDHSGPYVEYVNIQTPFGDIWTSCTKPQDLFISWQVNWIRSKETRQTSTSADIQIGKNNMVPCCRPSNNRIRQQDWSSQSLRLLRLHLHPHPPEFDSVSAWNNWRAETVTCRCQKPISDNWHDIWIRYTNLPLKYSCERQQLLIQHNTAETSYFRAG